MYARRRRLSAGAARRCRGPPGGDVFRPSGACCRGARRGLAAPRHDRWRRAARGTGEGCVGAPAGIGEDRCSVRGGDAPARTRLFVTPVRTDGHSGQGRGRGTVRAAGAPSSSPSAAGLSCPAWDRGHSRLAADATGAAVDAGFQVAVVRRRADVMLAEVAAVTIGAADGADGDGAAPSFFPRRSDVVAVDCRPEYCRPQAAFLATGALLPRLHTLLLPDGDDDAYATPGR